VADVLAMLAVPDLLKVAHEVEADGTLQLASEHAENQVDREFGETLLPHFYFFVDLLLVEFLIFPMTGVLLLPVLVVGVAVVLGFVVLEF